MTSKVMLIHPARHFIANKAGVGYLTPLGLIMLAGPLIDAGFDVKLIDHDMYGWSMKRLLQEIKNFQPNYILLGHSGSTASHNVAVETIKAIKKYFPEIRIVYGGVYPSYAYESIMQEVKEIDVIVRGEGEQTLLDLMDAWERTPNLDLVRGIVWRKDGDIIVNHPQPAIQNLDIYRPAWELVDWKHYQMFGFERAAGMQFSRGCPLTCSYCGQWMFWKKWRHRSPENILENMKLLKEKYAVNYIWFADENFSADRELTKQLFEMIIEAKLDISLNINMTAADVVRDADLIPLYKKAGVDYIVMGVESLNDSVIAEVRKNNPFDVSKEAVRLLRENHILSLTNIIYGLEEESWGTMWEKFKNLFELDSDIFNAVYLMPHFWTIDGKKTDPSKIIQSDLSKWSYRNQVLAIEKLSPLAFFLGVKLTEMLFHLRPKAIKRFLFPQEKKYGKIYRHSILNGISVFITEIWEFSFNTKFIPQGTMKKLHGQPSKHVDSSPLSLESFPISQKN